MKRENIEFLKTLYEVDNISALQFSVHTEKFYLNSRLLIKDGMFLKGASEHKDTPDEAVEVFRVNIKGKRVRLDDMDIIFV